MNWRNPTHVLVLALWLTCATTVGFWLSASAGASPSSCQSPVVQTSTDTRFLAADSLTVTEKLDRLSRVEVKTRMRAVRELRPIEQSALWREHWRRWLGPDSGLTPVQADLVRRAIERGSPEQYAKQYVDPESTAFWHTAASILSPEQFAALSQFIGQRPGQPRLLTPAPGLVTVWKRKVSFTLARWMAAAVPSLRASQLESDYLCNCDNYPGPCLQVCTCYAEPCNPTTNCGRGGELQVCTGVCLCCGCSS